MIITILIQNITRGAGSERAAVLLANYLCKNGYDVHIVSICGEGKNFYNIDRNITIHRLVNSPNVNNRTLFPVILYRLAKVLLALKPDVTIDVFSSLSIYTLILRKIVRYKVITWEHYGHEYSPGMIRFGRRVALRLSDRFVVLTNSEYRYFTPLSSDRCQVICIPNPTPYLSVNRTTKNEGRIIAACIGRLVSIKRYDRALKAWKIVERTSTENRLLIVGDGELRDSLMDLKESLGLKSVSFLGAKREIEEIYQESDISLVTSDSECMPMTIVESMSFGNPTITVNYGDGVYDLIENGINGYIVDGKTEEEIIEGLANKIINLQNDKILLESLSNNAYESSKLYDIDHIGKMWIRLLSGF